MPSWQVSPAEIEVVLRLHDLVADVAVAGILREDGLTEVPRAYVVRKPGTEAQTLNAEDVYNFSRKRLASYKALDGGVVFVDHIPRTASGKVQRFKLRGKYSTQSFVSQNPANTCTPRTHQRANSPRRPHQPLHSSEPWRAH